MRRAPLRSLKRTLLTGLFIVAPFSLTFLLIAWFVALIDGMLAPVIEGLIGRAIPGLGLAVAVALIFIAGILGSNIVGQHLLEFFEELLLKVPGFNWVYRTIKQLSEVFSPTGKTNFKGVVLVEYPRPGVYSMGFVTNELELERDGEREALVCVYIPTNHMYIGDYVLVPESNVVATKISQQDGIQAAISAGASLPELIRSSSKKS